MGTYVVEFETEQIQLIAQVIEASAEVNRVEVNQIVQGGNSADVDMYAFKRLVEHGMLLRQISRQIGLVYR